MNEMTSKKFLNQSQAGPFIGVHPSTLSRWRKSKKGPPFYQIGAQKMYLREDLEAWLEEQRTDKDKK